MVMPGVREVHVGGAQLQPLSRFSPRRLPGRAITPGVLQSWGISCAQTAIIPTNSVIDASVAASSTNVFNMPASSYWNIRRTLFRFCSGSQGGVVGQFEK